MFNTANKSGFETLSLRLFPLVGLWLSFFLVSCGSKSDEPRPDDWQGPWLVVADADHDFGPMFATETQRHTIKLENKGAKTLIIGRIKKDCGCAKPSLDRHEIPPGEFATLTLDFRPPVLGKLQKRIWVYCNDPYVDPFVIRLRAEGYGLARLEPAILRLEGELPPEGIEKTLILRAAEGETLRDVDFAENSPLISIEPIGPTEGRELKFRFQMSGLRESLSLRESIPVTFRLVNAGVNGRLTVPFQVLGRVHPRVQVSPPSLCFGGQPGEVIERVLELSSAQAEQGIEFVAHLEDGTFASVTPDAEAPGRRFRVRLTIPQNKARVATRCILKSKSGLQTLVVPLQGYAVDRKS